MKRERIGGELMNDMAKAARNEYARKWREKNKDKVRAAHDRYWEKKAREADEMKAQNLETEADE